MEDSSLYYIESEARVMDLDLVEVFHDEIVATGACTDFFGRGKGFYLEHLDWQQKLEKSSKQFTIAGVDIKVVCATNFSITASVMSSYGVKIEDSDLIGLKKFTYSVLNKKTPVAMLADCRNIISFIEPNLEGLGDYRIDEDYRDNLVDLADKLETLSKLPLAVIKQHANDKKQFEASEKKSRKFYDTEFDPFMEIYRIVDVSFYLAYTAARKVRHHHLKRKKPAGPVPTTGTLETMVVMKTTLLPVAGATLVIERVEKTYITDADGETYTGGLLPGLHHGKIVKKDCNDIVFDFTIVAGKTCAMQFVMEPTNLDHEDPPVS